MPIIEYFSPNTNKIYSFFARTKKECDLIPPCPDGANFIMERMVSSFAVTKGSKEESSGTPNIEDPRLEAAMAAMEKEMGALDEENPDPKKMGSLMRRMAEMTGEKLPAVMEEMMRRLEAGEDPEKLEEEFGDLPELDDVGSDGSVPEIYSSGGRRIFKKKAPFRDPKLYEYSESALPGK